MRLARRDRKKEAFWRRTIRRQPSSGMSVRAWCRKHALRESSFYWWRGQLARRDAEAPTFVPVRVAAGRPVPDACETNRIEIVLPGECCVRLSGPVDRRALTDVLAVVRSANFVAPGTAAC